MDLVFQNLTADKKYNSKFFENALDIAIKELKLNNKELGLSINLVGEDKIKELNNKYRGKNKITDVLSFPMTTKLITHNSKFLIHDLGDIFICLPFAKKEAKSENVSIETKLAQLTVHGFLHLVGYDHEKSDKDEERMFHLENQILKRL